MNHLYILNDAPYGSERTYNALRLAGAVSKLEGNAVRVFLIGDGASSAHRNQKVPAGFYNVETMLGNVTRHGGEVGICGTCMDARGMTDGDIADKTHRSTLAELAEWTVWADKVLVF
ncbi:DsrE/DsrF-like family protein [mine drainage metagenome]|uniref:DsrE/DsrF-like family protein n=1 Tax=mine drainage metagenome TaxID=410659 RepID=A0A1J5RWA2_9ZZZZ